MTLPRYLDELESRGKNYFTPAQALHDLGLSQSAFLSSASRLKRKGRLARPAKGIYIIIPAAYRALGSLPAEELLILLARQWQLDYYVALLSAGMYYGASHQKPQVFQVIASKQLRPITCGRVTITFIYKKKLSEVPVRQFTRNSGYLSVAAPETLAMDMFLYPSNSGGLNNIATVLSELMESLEEEKLLFLLQHSGKVAWGQRLGYVLEQIGPFEEEEQVQLVAALASFIQRKNPAYVPLSSSLPRRGERDKKWKIIVNEQVDSDL